jgi:hypothetical protein
LKSLAKRFGNSARNSGSSTPTNCGANVHSSLIKWHLDEVCYNGTRIGRLQSDAFANLLKKQGFVPRVIVTDKLKSDEAAEKQVTKNAEHRHYKELNNRAENSH